MHARFFVSRGRDFTSGAQEDVDAQDSSLLADRVLQGQDVSLGPASNVLTGTADDRIGLFDPGSGAFLPAFQSGPPQSALTAASGGYFFEFSTFTGNATVFGGNWGDLIVGGSGNDALNGGQGTDVLRAGFGNDILDGGAGSDRMGGGKGDDRYVVDSAYDRATEAAGEGRDTVTSSVSFVLRAGSEIETLQLASSTGSQDLRLTGNEFANTLIGNDGANRLDGGSGADVLSGGKGNDRYVVDNFDDHVMEAAGGGIDTIYASSDYCFVDGQEIEVLRANAGNEGLHLMGNELAQTIIGGAGGDILHGDGGADVLIGQGGRDSFAFVAPVDATPRNDRPTVVDFARGEDAIFLKTLQAVDSAATDQAFTWIGANAFTKQAGQLHQVIYKNDTYVEGDINGDGAADIQIRLTGIHDLQASDFVL